MWAKFNFELQFCILLILIEEFNWHFSGQQLKCVWKASKGSFTLDLLFNWLAFICEWVRTASACAIGDLYSYLQPIEPLNSIAWKPNSIQGHITEVCSASGKISRFLFFTFGGKFIYLKSCPSFGNFVFIIIIFLSILFIYKYIGVFFI